MRLPLVSDSQASRTVVSLLFLVGRVPYLNYAGPLARGFGVVSLEPGGLQNAAAFRLRLPAVLGRPPKGTRRNAKLLQGQVVVSFRPKGFPWFPSQDVAFFCQGGKVDTFPGVRFNVHFQGPFRLFGVLGRVPHDRAHCVLFMPARHNHYNGPARGKPGPGDRPIPVPVPPPIHVGKGFGVVLDRVVNYNQVEPAASEGAADTSDEHSAAVSAKVPAAFRFRVGPKLKAQFVFVVGYGFLRLAAPFGSVSHFVRRQTDLLPGELLQEPDGRPV